MNHWRWKLIETLTSRKKVSSRGLEFTLPNDNWITHYRWETFNSKEPEMLDWIDQTLKPGDVFFDIGANIGVYSLYAALRHPGLKVFAFEPEYANLHLLRDNVAANNLQDRISIYSLAMGRRTMLSHLQVQDLTPGAALHTESDQKIEKTLTGKCVLFREGISVMTIDDFCRQTGVKPQAMKIDVDGTEADILTGAQSTLSSPEFRSLIMEIVLKGDMLANCTDRLNQASRKRTFTKEIDGCLIGVWS